MGNPESSLTQGLNWGIASLLGVVMAVLGGAVTFFVALARRAARYERQTPSDGKSIDVAMTQATGKIQ